MKIDEIIALSKSEGFEVLLKTSKLEFDFSFRKYCEQNLCGNFGTSPYCPPLCKSAEELKNEVLKHKFILVLKSEHNIPDLADGEKIKAANAAHNEATLGIINKLPKFCGALALCTYTDIEIPQNVTAACLSAYCVNVLKMAKSCQMSYAYKDSTLPLFGFITLD